MHNGRIHAKEKRYKPMADVRGEWWREREGEAEKGNAGRTAVQRCLTNTALLASPENDREVWGKEGQGEKGRREKRLRALWGEESVGEMFDENSRQTQYSWRHPRRKGRSAKGRGRCRGVRIRREDEKRLRTLKMGGGGGGGDRWVGRGDVTASSRSSLLSDRFLCVSSIVFGVGVIVWFV